MARTDPGLTGTDIQEATNEPLNAPETDSTQTEPTAAPDAAPEERTWTAAEVARIVQEADAQASLAVAIGLARAARQLYSTNRRKAAETLAAQVVDEVCAYAAAATASAALPD